MPLHRFELKNLFVQGDSWSAVRFLGATVFPLISSLSSESVRFEEGVKFF